MMPALSRADTSVIGRWWWSVDRVTLIALAVLIAVGYVLALAAMPGMTMRLSNPDTQAMLRQILFLALGGATMLGMSMLSLRQVKLAALGLGILFFLLTVFTLVHGVEVDGAHRWISMPGFTIQPSEFLRPGFIIISAWLIAEARRTPGFPGKRAALGVFLLVAFVLKTQPDIGMTFLFTMVVFVQFYLDGMDMKWVWVAAAAVVLAFIGAFLSISHVHTRVMLFLHPTKQSAYQALTALSAFGNGGMFGLGPGEGQVKQYLPDARADFVFAVAGEEFGLFFCGFIILVFAAIVVRALLRLLTERDLFVLLAAGGLVAGFGLEAFVNMASSLSLIPTKGMTLPFISYGGSSVLAISIQMGFLLALTRKRHQSQNL
jgi:cell division protein FtsW